MSSFGVNNILRKGIVTNIFFNKSEEIVDYLPHKCPQFNYEHIPSEDVRIMQKDSIIIRNCMKQHLIVFTPTDGIFLKEYLCSCSSCLQFNFKECTKESLPNDVSLTDDVESYDESDDGDDGIDKTEQIFNFVDVPSFISLFSSSPNEPPYFVKIVEKVTASEDINDRYGHFISAGEMFFKGFYLKMARSKNVGKKMYQILPTEIVFSPDEVFDTYIEFSEDLYLDINIHNSLLQKANSHL